MLQDGALGAIVIAETLALVIVSTGLGIALSGPTTVETPPPPGPVTIGMSRTDNAQNWILTVISVRTRHSLSTTTS